MKKYPLSNFSQGFRSPAETDRRGFERPGGDLVVYPPIALKMDCRLVIWTTGFSQVRWLSASLSRWWRRILVRGRTHGCNLCFLQRLPVPPGGYYLENNGGIGVLLVLWLCQVDCVCSFIPPAIVS
jgi:hypothetical protein